MLDINDFSAKQIIIYNPSKGDRLSYKNDNLIITDKEGITKYQHTCYRIFMLLIIGDCTITTGILRRAKKFGFSICFMSYSFRFLYSINAGLEGNNYLHKKQYEYSGTELGRVIILNKIKNQRNLLGLIRKKTDYIKEGIEMLNQYIYRLESERDMERSVILGIEGNAAKVYFPRIFDNVNWKSRKPRIKFDYVNSLLDIGYMVLFNFIDCILHVYDFDVYEGVLHTAFYMRKSLVCDLVEPFRCIIDWRVRKGIALGQFKEEDFIVVGKQYQLEYKKSGSYSSIFMGDLLDCKEAIFVYIRSYYRSFMKGIEPEQYPMFDITTKGIVAPEVEDI